MRIAILGLGSIGSRHVDNLLSLGHTDLLGYDLAPNVEEERLPVVDDFEAVQAWQPDYALVCTPPAAHAVDADALMQQGCHVFVEKPLAVTVAQAEALCHQADVRGVILAVGYQLRAIHSVETFPRDWKILHIWDRQNMAAWPASTYERDWLAEFSHELDLAMYWAGSYPDKIDKETWQQERRLYLRWKDGRLCLVDLSPTYHGYDRRASSDVANWTFSHVENDLAYKDELKYFLDGKPLCTGQDGLNVVRLLEALR